MELGRNLLTVINLLTANGYKQLKSLASMIKTEYYFCKNNLFYNNRWRRRKTEPFFKNLDQQSITYSESGHFKAL